MSVLPSTDLVDTGAVQIARQIASGQVSSREIVQAHIDRIERVDDKLNAVVVRRFEEALREADAADDARQCGAECGALHGVPVTVKECFYVRGTQATMGLTSQAGILSDHDAPLVEALRGAGAIILGKTNVSQLMVLHESINPVYGRTSNPWAPGRVAGGSTGGEAAIIATGASPLGLGSDLGGSIRIPAHFCGVHGFKPTSGRLTRQGTRPNFRGMESLHSQPGPLARHVDDLIATLRVLTSSAENRQDVRVSGRPLGDPANVSLDGMRVGVFSNDGFFKPSAAVRRAVEEAADALANLGAIVEPFQPPDVEEMMRIYVGIMTADGAADMRRLLQGSERDHRVKKMVRVISLPRWMRPPLAAMLRLLGEDVLAKSLTFAGPRSADAYWQLIRHRIRYCDDFSAVLRAGNFAALIFPPYALAAPKHGRTHDLMAAASYAFLPNLLGFPAGVVAAARVRQNEQEDRLAGRDSVLRAVQRSESGSAGLPIGVQVAAPMFEDHVVLAVMKALEQHFRKSPDYPLWDKATLS